MEVIEFLERQHLSSGREHRFVSEQSSKKQQEEAARVKHRPCSEACTSFSEHWSVCTGRVRPFSTARVISTGRVQGRVREFLV